VNGSRASWDRAKQRFAKPWIAYRGESVDEAVWWFITMDRSCQAQLLAEAAGKPIAIDREMRWSRGGKWARMARAGSSFSRCGSGLLANSPTCSTKSDCYFGPRNTLDSEKVGHAGRVFCAAGPVVFVEAECFEAEAQRALVVIVSYRAVGGLDLGTHYNSCDAAAAPVPCSVAFIVAGSFVISDDEESGVLKEFASE